MIEGERRRYYGDTSSGSQNPPDEDSLPYSNFQHDPRGDFVEPNYLGYSDYSGSLVERSNVEAFIEEFSESQGKEWWELYGSHGTRAIVIRRDADERVPEIGEFIDGLSNYPLADEERHSELEQEIQDEAWDQWGRREFRQLIAGAMDDDELAEQVDAAPDRVIDRVWYQALQDGDGSEASTEGQDAIFRFDRVLQRIDPIEEFTRAAVAEMPATAREALVKAFPQFKEHFAVFSDSVMARLTTGADAVDRNGPGDLFAVLNPEPITTDTEKMGVVLDAIHASGDEWGPRAEAILRNQYLGRYAR